MRAISGAIEYEGDVDWYRFSARTGNRYRITNDHAADINRSTAARYY